MFSMQHRWSALLIGASLAFLPHAADAAARKPARKIAAKPVAMTVALPAIAMVHASRGGFMVPKAIVLRPATSAESEANAIWNLRAALNVAALQCQFSKYLATVKNYNDFLKQHSDELVKAQTVLLAHFKRYDKASALNSFDQYTTRTYNSYSTLDAQYQFCDAAGLVGREVLTVPKSGLGKVAMLRGAEIRSSMERRPLSPALAVVQLSPLPLPPITPTEK